MFGRVIFEVVDDMYEIVDAQNHCTDLWYPHTLHFKQDVVEGLQAKDELQNADEEAKKNDIHPREGTAPQDFEFQCMSTSLTMWSGLIFTARHDTCTSSRRPAKLLILYTSFVSYKEWSVDSVPLVLLHLIRIIMVETIHILSSPFFHFGPKATMR